MSIFSNDQLLEIFELYNPWWQKGSLPEKYNFKQKRNSYYDVHNALFNSNKYQFILVNGTRRIGKSVILYQIISDLLANKTDPKKIIFLSFDHPIVKFSGITGAMDAIDSVCDIKNKLKKGEEYWFFLDEIQYADDWYSWINDVSENYRNTHVLSTVSATNFMSQQKELNTIKKLKIIKTSTLSFYEYCNFLDLNKNIEIPENISIDSLFTKSKNVLTSLLQSLERIQPHFMRYLMVGGLPEYAIASNNPTSIKLYHADIVNKIVKPDLSSLYNIRNTLQMEKVFLYLCLNSGKAINIEKMSTELDGMNKISIHNYIQFLYEANIIYISEPVPLNDETILKSRPKIYIADAAIRNSILLTDKTQPKDDELDRIVEAALFKNLSVGFPDKIIKMGYYRKPTGNHPEIDIVLQTKDNYFLYDVQFLDSTNFDLKNTIMDFYDKHSENLKSITLITKNNDDYGCNYSENLRIPIFKIPAYAFLYLLGYVEKQAKEK